MSYWLRLLQALGLQISPETTFLLDEDIIQALQTLAEQEQRPEGEIAAEIITRAITLQNTSQQLWQRWSSLSPREQQVAMMLCHNYTTSEMSNQLMVSSNTIKTHILNVLHKFEAKGRKDLRIKLAEFDFDRLMDQ